MGNVSWLPDLLTSMVIWCLWKCLFSGEGPLCWSRCGGGVASKSTMNTSKAAELSDLSLKWIVAGKEVGIQVMVELCERVLDGL